MTLVCEINEVERNLLFKEASTQPLTEQRQSLKPAQKLRWPPAQHEIFTPFWSKAALYGTAAIFLVGIAAAFFFVVAADGEFPITFLSQVRGPPVNKFVLGRDNLALLVFDITVMASSICFLFVLPDIHWRSQRNLDTPLISPGRARKIRWGNYGGIAGLILGLGGLFASRFAPGLSTFRYVYPEDLVSLGFAPPVTWLFVGPQDIAFLGFAAAGICYGMLGLAGVSFVPRQVAKMMIILSIFTGILVGIIVILPIPPMVVTFLYWGLLLGTITWLVPFNQAYVKCWQDAMPENTEFANIDPAIQKTLWILGITSQQQLANEDSQELGAILGVEASRVDQWKGMTPQAPAPKYSPRFAMRTEETIKTLI